MEQKRKEEEKQRKKQEEQERKQQVSNFWPHILRVPLLYVKNHCIFRTFMD